MNRRTNANAQHYAAWQDEEFEEKRYSFGDEDLDDAQPWHDNVEEIIATNRMVMLSCTLAAMLPPFALFLIFAEKKSRAIRYFSMQSMLLTAVHLLTAAVLMVINAVLGGIPYLGFLMNLVLWIAYIVALIVMLILRIRMMFCAWRGVKFTLPIIGGRAERYC